MPTLYCLHPSLVWEESDSDALNVSTAQLSTKDGRGFCTNLLHKSFAQIFAQIFCTKLLHKSFAQIFCTNLCTNLLHKSLAQICCTNLLHISLHKSFAQISCTNLLRKSFSQIFCKKILGGGFALGSGHMGFAATLFVEYMFVCLLVAFVCNVCNVGVSEKTSASLLVHE